MSGLGFIQLLSSDGEVLEQLEGVEKFLHDYQRQNWPILRGRHVRFVKESDYVQPWKFMKAIHRNAEVELYDGDFLDVEVGESPDRRLAKAIVKASDIPRDDHAGSLIGCDWWEAYSDGEWVGSSEV